MGRLRRFLGLEAEPPPVSRSAFPNPGGPLAIPTPDTLIGLRSGELRALGTSAAFRCVSMIADTVAGLSWQAWSATETEIVPDQPSILRRPDPFAPTSDTLRRLVGELLTTGNAYAYLTAPDRSGRPTVAIPVPSSEVESRWNDKRQRREYRWRGGDELEPYREILPIHYLDIPGHDRGLGPIQSARWIFEGALLADQQASEMFRSGVPDGVLSHPGRLTEDEAEALRAQWVGRSATGQRRGTAVLQGGMTYEPISWSAADLQFVEQRQMSSTEIARLFGVPAPLISAPVPGSSSLTYRNLESVRAEYVMLAIQPITDRLEAAFGELLPSTQRVRFRLSDALRADSRTRFDVYQIGISTGVLTVNEARELEGLPPRPGGGDVLSTPVREADDGATAVGEEA